MLEVVRWNLKLFRGTACRAHARPFLPSPPSSRSFPSLFLSPSMSSTKLPQTVYENDVSDIPAGTPAPAKKGFKFWMIFLSLCLAMFLSALEFSGVATALPVIINELHGDDFVWVGAAYALASTAFLPMSGGLAEVRLLVRSLLVLTCISTLLGTDIWETRRHVVRTVVFHPRQCALWRSTNHELAHSREKWVVISWLIRVRRMSDTSLAVQGLGGGAILSTSSIVVSDLVPLSERGAYNGIIGL